MWKPRVVVAAIVALVCAASAVDPSRPGDEVCTLSSANQCPVDALKPSVLDGSVLIYPGGKTRCAFDDYTDPSGNFSTNKTFFFQVFPNKQQQLQQAKKKVLLYFQGGGACTDADTCNFALQCSLGKSSTFTTYAFPFSSGVFNRTNPVNVFKDWDIVYVPYCTGDLHAGSAVHDGADSLFASFLGQPQCLNKNMKMHMTGYENSMSALKWAKANYPSPEHLIIGGASAGSLGSQMLSALVADLWKVESSSIRYSVLADSYIGVLPVEKPAATVLSYFGVCDVDLKLPAATVSACKAKTMTAGELVSAALQTTPSAYWLHIDSKADRTQRYYYQLVKEGIAGYPFPNLLSGEAFFKQASAMIDLYRTVSSRVSTFFVEGEKHVFTLYEDYGNTLSDTGEKLGEFLTKWLVSTGSPPTAAPTPTTTPAVPAPTTAKPTPSVRPGC